MSGGTSGSSGAIVGQTLKVFLYLPDPDATLAGGYDQIKIEQQDSDGNWANVDDDSLPIPIESGKCNYWYLVTGVDPGEYYRPVLADSGAVNPDIPQAPRQGIDTEYEAILTPDELKNIYLFGVDLTDDNNNPFPDELLAHYIKTGISQIEVALDITLLPTKIVENHDFWLRDYERFMFVDLKRKPVISVDKVALEYPSGSDVIDFPAEWVRLDRHAAQIQVLPARGTFNQMLVSAGGGFLPLVFGGSEFIPDIIRVEYVAGFDLGEKTSRNQFGLPHAVKEVVGKKAAFGPFNTAGDLIVGAGIANKSISIDGLSQTIGTTSSATNAGYGSRLIQYEKELKQQIPELRNFYHGTRMTVL